MTITCIPAHWRERYTVAPQAGEEKERRILFSCQRQGRGLNVGRCVGTAFTCLQQGPSQ